MNECVPGQQTTRYHGIGLMNKHRIIIYISRTEQINHACKANHLINQP